MKWNRKRKDSQRVIAEQREEEGEAGHWVVVEEIKKW